MLQLVRRKQYWAVLTTLISLLFIAAFMEHHIVLTILFVAALFGILGSLISTIWGSSLLRTLSLAAAALAIVSGFMAFIPGPDETLARALLAVCCFSYAVFILMAILSIGRHVFITDRVTANRIIGSVCIYMLIGMFYAFVYAAMALISRSTFQMNTAGNVHPMVGLRDFFYFSYSTLTTTGFGDMVPTHPISRVVACLEEVSGSVYLVIMVARLVGMHVAQAHPGPQHHSQESQ